jgi:hypothetical protein
MLGAGDGTFTLKGEYPAGIMSEDIAVADVTGDGKPDVLVYSSFTSVLSVYPGDGDGALEPRWPIAIRPHGVAARRRKACAVSATGA